MATGNKFRSNVWLAVKSLVVGSVVVSRVFAAPAPVAPNHDGLVSDWRSLGDQMSGQQPSLPPLSDHLIDMIATADLRNNLAEVVAASYEIVSQSQLRALDAHWASVLTATSDATLVAEYLNVRSSIDLSNFAETKSDDLLWLAKGNGNRGGNCDNGFGNADDGAPGGSDPNNGAENDDDLGDDPTRCNAGQGGGGSPACKNQ